MLKKLVLSVVLTGIMLGGLGVHVQAQELGFADLPVANEYENLAGEYHGIEAFSISTRLTQSALLFNSWNTPNNQAFGVAHGGTRITILGRSYLGNRFLIRLEEESNTWPARTNAWVNGAVVPYYANNAPVVPGTDRW